MLDSSPPLDGLRGWLQQRGVEGVTATSVDHDPERHDDELMLGGGLVRLQWTCEVDEADAIRSLVVGLLNDHWWLGAVEGRVQPPVSGTRLGCELVLCAVSSNQLASETLAARARREDRREHLEELAAPLDVAMSAHHASLDDDEAQRFEEGLQEWASTSWYVSDRDEQEREFLRSLPARLRPIAQDFRFLAFLLVARLRVVEAVDEWAAGLDGAEEPPGFELQTHPWNPRRGQSCTPIPPRGDAPPPPDPETLYARTLDPQWTHSQRNEAGQRLAALPPEVGMPWQVRLLGEERDRMNLLTSLVRHPALTDFLLALALRPRAAGTVALLDGLVNYDTSDADPRDAVHTSEPLEQHALDGLYQDHVVHLVAVARGQDIEPLRGELERVVDDPARRRPDWVQAVLLGLGGASASIPAHLASTVARFVDHPEARLRATALRFFHRVEHPPVWSALQAALFDEDDEVVAAACDGLAGQPGLGTTVLYRALECAQRIAARQGGRAGRHAMLGLSLLRRLSTLGPCENPRLVAQVKSRLSDFFLSPELRTFGEEATSPEAMGPPPPADPIAAFERGIARFRDPGHAGAHYDRRGHRDPAWDEAVHAGHRAYDGDDFTAARASFEQALAAGCEDGMVAYRTAVTLHAESPECAIEAFGRARSLLLQQEPDSVYVPATAEAIGNILRAAGRLEEALLWLRRSVQPELRPRDVGASIAELERATRLERLAHSDAPPLRLGDLRPIPSRWHPASVSALSIGPGDDPLLLASADVEGGVQVSGILPLGGAFPMVEPWARVRVHGAGPTSVVWADDSTLISAGADGRVCSHRIVDGGLESSTLRSFDVALCALARRADGVLVVADVDGDVRILGVPDRILARRREERILSLQTRGSQLVGLGTGGSIEAWNASGALSYALHGPFGAACLVGEDRVLLLPRPDAPPPRERLVIAAHDGEVLERQPVEGTLPFAGWSDGTDEVWAWPEGPIRAAEKTIVVPRVDRLDVRGDQRLLAYVGERHELSINGW